MAVKLDSSWLAQLQDEFRSPYFESLRNFLTKEKENGKIIYPPGPLIFAALDTTPFDKVKVVILGQDPYHGPGQANGLSFSVNDGVPLPPSLRNIYKELQSDLGIPAPHSGNLLPWARQGVLLLNATLTVQANEAGSHQNKGWEQFTDKIIDTLSAKREKLVFILWGKFAQGKAAMIDSSKHLVLSAAHPSPFSADRGFFGSNPFSTCNKYLEQQGITPVDWHI